MKNFFTTISQRMWKDRATLISLFLFAGCIQEDEGLVPRNNQSDLLSNEIADELVSAEMKTVFTAHLSPSNEISTTPIDSKGTGQVIFTLSDDGTELHYKLIVANIDEVTQSHIHCGEEGSNGPAVVFLFEFVEGGVTENGVVIEGTITEEDIMATCEGLSTFEDLLELMRSGGAYANVHTVTYPGGEIRGQIR
jgi:hypothetical protein